MIDVTQLFPRLRDRRTFASFDPVSGVMLVDLPLEEFSRVASTSTDGATFAADEDSTPLLVSLNHETYHFFQTLCTGYMRQQAQRKHALVTQAVRSWSEKLNPTSGIVNRAIYGIVRRIANDESERKRIDDAAFALFLRNQLASTDSDGGATLVGQTSPDTIRALRSMSDEEAKIGANGLSTLSVIEGGAMTYQYLLSYGRKLGEEKLLEEWGHLPDDYQLAFAYARAHHPGLYFDLMLPCTALALCYERPAEAFAWFVIKLSTGGDRATIHQRARDLYVPLPRLPGNRRIGRASVLGRSIRPWHRLPKYDVYDAAAAALSGVDDEFRLLTDATAASDYPDVMLQIVLACDGGSIPSPSSHPWVLPRLTLATLTLQTAGAARWRREAERQLGEWGGQVLRRAFGGTPRTPA